MTDIKIYNSITQSITNDISLFKNKEQSQIEFNKQMIIKMCLLLNLSEELKNKNEKIKEIRKKEIERLLKLYEENKEREKNKTNNTEIDESSDEDNNDENYCLNVLENPTLQIYIPMNQTSYSLEDNIIIELNGKMIIDDNLINKKKVLDEESENNNIDLSFEEPVILSEYKFKNETETNFLNLIDEFLEDNEFTKNVNCTELNSDNPIVFINEKIDISFAQQRKNYKIAFNEKNNLNKENINSDNSLNNIYQNEFKNYLSLKTFEFYNKHMNITYLNKILGVYIKIKNKSDLSKYCEEKMFLNLTKIYLLKCGISDKTIYEDTLRNLIYKGGKYHFESFLNCFLKILKLTDDNLIILYKFLMYLLVNDDKEEINLKTLKQYCNEMITSKMVYDEELCDEIRKKIIKKYNALYKGEYQIFNIRNILIILETFFENK